MFYLLIFLSATFIVAMMATAGVFSYLSIKRLKGKVEVRDQWLKEADHRTCTLVATSCSILQQLDLNDEEAKYAKMRLNAWAAVHTGSGGIVG